MNWYILTGEYPPARGGVSDYTSNVARALAASGARVYVFAPKTPGASGGVSEQGGVTVFWLSDCFGWRGLIQASRVLRNAPTGRMIVQYVPHAFGLKGMNLPFCWWAMLQRRHRLWVMFHEVAFPLEKGQSWRRWVLAQINLRMASALLRNASRVLVSTTAWVPTLQELSRRPLRATPAPIPSNFEGEHCNDIQSPLSLFPNSASGLRLVGHFGTFGPLIGDVLKKILNDLLRKHAEVAVILVGRGSREFATLYNGVESELGRRVKGVGEVSPATAIGYLRCCELLLQPFVDGVSTRRTSVMCSLALGLTVVTQAGHLTESIWAESGGVKLVPSSEPAAWSEAVAEMLASPAKCGQIAASGKELYWRRFSLRRTLGLLLDTSGEAQI